MWVGVCVCMHACVRLCVCSVFIHPNRKHLNCKAIHLFWHSMTSSRVGLQRACSRPSSAGEETFSLPLADCNNKTKEPPGHLGSDLAGGAFPSFSHLRTWEVCERVRVQRAIGCSYMCVLCVLCVRALKHTWAVVGVSPNTYTPTHPPTHLTPVIFTTCNIRWQSARFTCTVQTCTFENMEHTSATVTSVSDQCPLA